MNKHRKKTMIEIERIIGNEFYNANIQNWGPGGVFEGEGRHFRYPVVFRDSQGGCTKSWHVAGDMPDDMLMTGTYRLGGNQLSIMRAVDQIITYFEENYGVDLRKPKS